MLIMNATRGLQAQLVAYRDGKVVPLSSQRELPAFLGARDMVFIVPEGVPPTQPLYAHLVSGSNAPQYLSVSQGALQSTLALGAERARMIALTFGALMAVSLAALLDLVRAQGSAVHFICNDVFSCRRCTWPIFPARDSTGRGFPLPRRSILSRGMFRWA